VDHLRLAWTTGQTKRGRARQNGAKGGRKKGGWAYWRLACRVLWGFRSC